jgi:acyl-CoA reductase-like NAD-dependent aldehyde dehydrogenase
MGNTVILKGSEASPAAYWALASVLHEAGLPPGCLNTLTHDPKHAADLTALLISSPIVKKVNFTGSTRVGSIVAALAGQHLKPVLLELGGKAPSIVCEDADIDKAALQCALGAFLHSGQICMSTERIIVNEKVAIPFAKALQATMDHLSAADGAEIPILINKHAVSRNRSLIQDAIDKGAKVVYGDLEHSDAFSTKMRPVILKQVAEGMAIYHTESFGPTVSIIEVADDDEALRIANDTSYGLTSAVFTRDLRRGLRISSGLETGAVHINSMTIHDEAGLPHGGAKQSGWGRFNGREGLEEWVRTKVVTFDV